MKAQEITQRREQIIGMILEKGKLETEAVANLFGVSTETIRQDFAFLAKKGILEKVYGGAKLASAEEIGPLVSRQQENFLTKDRIVRKALEFIPDEGGVIGMDTGSTIALLASYLGRLENRLIVTNSHPVMHSIAGTRNRLYALGGEYNKTEMSYNGEQAVHSLQKLSLDVSFVGTSGVLNRNGICAKSFEEIQLKQEYIHRCGRSIVLADSTKFTHSSLVEVAPWSDIDILITDSGIPDIIRTQLEKEVAVVIAD